MKRLFCIILIACFFCSGCTAGEHFKEPVTFYYIREDYQKDMEQVIESEIREASGHREDLPYLLALYSMGPSREGLVSFFPRSTQIIPVERNEDKLVLRLSGSQLTLTDAQFTLASTCLALTCMDLTAVREITVESGEQRITIREDNLMLQASIPTQQEEPK